MIVWAPERASCVFVKYNTCINGRLRYGFFLQIPLNARHTLAHFFLVAFTLFVVCFDALAAVIHLSNKQSAFFSWFSSYQSGVFATRALMVWFTVNGTFNRSRQLSSRQICTFFLFHFAEGVGSVRRTADGVGERKESVCAGNAKCAQWKATNIIIPQAWMSLIFAGRGWGRNLRRHGLIPRTDVHTNTSQRFACIFICARAPWAARPKFHFLAPSSLFSLYLFCASSRIDFCASNTFS